MAESIRMIVDGTAFETEAGVRIIDALRAGGFDIPSLCYTPKTESNRRCSLCVAEQKTGDTWRVIHTCHAFVEASLELRTESAKLTAIRAQSAAILLARGPFRNERLTALLEGLCEKGRGSGISVVTISAAGKKRDYHSMAPGCVLCGRCVEICRKVNKKRLAFLGRGDTLRIACTGEDGCGRCKACSKVCSTGFINGSPDEVFTAYFYKHKG